MSLEEARKLIRVIPRKHKSILEHVSWTFLVTGISRACSHEMVRHRHLSFSQRSQRYVDEQNASFSVPARLIQIMGEEVVKQILNQFQVAYRAALEAYAAEGIVGEEANQDARYFLPNATETIKTATGNGSGLLNFFNLRMCHRAQEEIRYVAQQMFQQVYETAPSIFEDAGPDCLTIGCRERKRSCGLADKVREEIAELKKRL